MFENMKSYAAEFEIMLEAFCKDEDLTLSTTENTEIGTVHLLLEDGKGHKLTEDVLLHDLMKDAEQPALHMERIEKHWQDMIAGAEE